MRDWNKIAEDKNLLTLFKATGDWRRGKGFKTGWSNFPEKLMLILTELAEVNAAFFIEDEEGNLRLDEDNFLEEWIDVAVRTIDLMEACDLYPSSRLIKTFEEPLRSEMLEIYKEGKQDTDDFYKQIKETGWGIALDLSSIMEMFRDIEVKKGKAILSNKKAEVSLDLISAALSNILLETFYQIETEYKSWWEEYAKKMQKNEERAIKHGRKR